MPFAGLIDYQDAAVVFNVTGSAPWLRIAKELGENDLPWTLDGQYLDAIEVGSCLRVDEGIVMYLNAKWVLLEEI